MSDSFFKYFTRERSSHSNLLYGAETPRFKEYKRFLKIALPEPVEVNTPLQEALKKRRSVSRDAAGGTISLEEASAILGRSAGLTRDSFLPAEQGERRPHPSGGAKYPIELYVFAMKVEGLEKAFYHYNVRDHALEKFPTKFPEDVSALYPYDPMVKDASFLVLFSYIKGRQFPKYGGFAYKPALIEAGHIGQNMYLVAAALSIGCRALAENNLEKLEELLQIDGGNESLFYTVLFAK